MLNIMGLKSRNMTCIPHITVGVSVAGFAGCFLPGYGELSIVR